MNDNDRILLEDFPGYTKYELICSIKSITILGCALGFGIFFGLLIINVIKCYMGI